MYLNILKKRRNIIIGKIEGIRDRKAVIRNIITVKYSINIEKVPDSIAIIPLLGLAYPVSLLLDDAIETPVVDKDYLDSLFKITEVYRRWYPSLKRVAINARRTEYNKIEPIKIKSGLLFSGGVDSTHLLLKHLHEKPILLTIIGFDIELNDIKKIEETKKELRNIARKYGLSYHLMFCSSFYDPIYLDCISFYKLQRSDFWGGLGSGVAIPSIVAPLVYALGLEKIYISCGLPSWFKYPWSDRMEIYGNLRFAGIKVIPEGYAETRLRKIEEIAQFVHNTSSEIKLRVCFSRWGRGTLNCGRCEKCQRTMAELLALGENPLRYGFPFKKLNLNFIKGISPVDLIYWKEIQLNNPEFVPSNLAKLVKTTRLSARMAVLRVFYELGLYGLYESLIGILIRIRGS